jgi:hypothetical protein
MMLEEKLEQKLERMTPNDRFAYMAALRNLSGCVTTFSGGPPKIFTETLARGRSGSLSAEERAAVDEMRSGMIRVTHEPVRIRGGDQRSALERELAVRRETLQELGVAPAVVAPPTKPKPAPTPKRDASPKRSRHGYIPPAAPPTDELTYENCGVEVRTTAARGHRKARIILVRSAYEAIVDSAQRHDGLLESGGGLYAHRHLGGEFRIFSTTETAYDKTRTSCCIDPFDIEAAETRRANIRDNELCVGSWHLQPDCERSESPADLYHWRMLIDRANIRHGIRQQVHLIVSEDADTGRGWYRPVFTGYSVRMEKDSLGTRVIREPAEVVLPR